MVQLQLIRRSGWTGKLIRRRNSIIVIVKISVTGIFAVFRRRRKSAQKKYKVTGSGIRINGIGQHRSEKVTIYYPYKNSFNFQTVTICTSIPLFQIKVLFDVLLCEIQNFFLKVISQTTCPLCQYFVQSSTQPRSQKTTQMALIQKLSIKQSQVCTKPYIPYNLQSANNI